MTTVTQQIKYSEIRKLFQNIDNLNERDMELIKRLYNKGYNDIVTFGEQSKDYSQGWDDGWKMGYLDAVS